MYDLCSEIPYSFSLRCAVVIGYEFSADSLQTTACSDFFISCERFQPAFHQAVYHGIFIVLYSLSVF